MVGIAVGVLLSVAYTMALVVYMVLSHTQSVVAHHSVIDTPHVLGTSLYVVLLVVAGHASMALATDASTVTTYTPESITSHYVGW